MSRFTVAEVSTKDFMGVRLVEFHPKRGAVTTLTGRRNAGKSSVIQSLWYLFLGKVAAPEMATRKGAKGHEITVKIDGEKQFTAVRDQNRLDIKMAPGCAAWGTPQAMLDSITNEFMLNPIKFVQLGRRENGKEGKREQVAWLLNSLELGVDLTQLKKDNEADFRKRTVANGEAKRLEGEMAGIVVRNDLPEKRPDLDAIRARIREVNEHNSTVGAQIEARRRIEQARAEAQANEERNNELIAKLERTTIENLVAEIEALKPAITSARHIRDTASELKERALVLPASPDPRIPTPASSLDSSRIQAEIYMESVADRIETAKAELETARKSLKAANQQRRPLAAAVAEAMMALEQSPKPEWHDTSALVEELDEAQTIHREMDKQDRKKILAAELEERRAESRALTLAMERRDEQRDGAIANAKMPVEGLSFIIEEGREEILYDSGNGPVPLSQQGEATQIKVSIAIGLASNPALRLVIIPNGEALDDDSVAELEQMAEEKDFQVIMAKVDSSGSVGIFLEEGEIKTVNEPKKKGEAPSEKRH